MMPKVHTAPLWQRAVILLSGTVVGLVIVLGLRWGRPVLIPIALAVLLTFLLNPISGSCSGEVSGACSR